MGPKRSHDALADNDDELSNNASSSNKRRREQPKRVKHGEGKPDPTYGQRVAFPGLDGDDDGQTSDSDIEWEDNGDVLAYLRAVR